MARVPLSPSLKLSDSRQSTLLHIKRKDTPSYLSMFHALLFIYQKVDFLSLASPFTVYRFVHRLDATKAHIPLARN
jgi:hypothetical protein